MPAFVDRTGMRYGRLSVLERAPTVNGRTYWACRCICGREVVVMGQSLHAGTTVSCGCNRAERIREKGHNVTHGLSGTRTYRIWCGMRKRCLNPAARAYARYGGRGVTACERWSRFENFLADMGECPDGLTIERIDNDRGYEPSNCKWATYAEQSANRRNTVKFDGLTLPELARRDGIPYATAYYRAKLKRPRLSYVAGGDE